MDWNALILPALAIAVGLATVGMTPADDPTKNEPKEGEQVAVLETTQGRIVILFFADKAPNHVARFKECIEKGAYTGMRFHRVIPGFVIQGGDPNTKDGPRATHGTGGFGDPLKQEFNDVPHVRGILSAARTSDPNSFRSQFFICHARAASLDREYTVFGRVIEGMEVVDKIVALPRDSRDNPLDDEASRVKEARLATWPLKAD